VGVHGEKRFFLFAEVIQNMNEDAVFKHISGITRVEGVTVTQQSLNPPGFPKTNLEPKVRVLGKAPLLISILLRPVIVQ
jgi:hypothetical protein